MVLFWVAQIIRLYSYVLLAQALMSWFVDPSNKLYQFLRRITEPFVGLFRPLAMKVTSKMGLPIDLAFLFAVLALQLLAGIVQSLMSNLATMGRLL